MRQPIELTSDAAIGEMLEKSKSAQILLYKHSMSCPVSSYAWCEVQDCLLANEDAPECYRVTVQLEPGLSRNIAETLDVVHHTPQVIILRDGKASYVASHWKIRKQSLQRELLGNAPAAQQPD